MRQRDCEQILSNLLDEAKRADIKIVEGDGNDRKKTRRKSFDNDDSTNNIVDETKLYNSTRRRSFDKGSAMKELMDAGNEVNYDKPLTHFVKIKPNRRRGSFDETAAGTRHTRRRSFG